MYVEENGRLLDYIAPDENKSKSHFLSLKGCGFLAF